MAEILGAVASGLAVAEAGLKVGGTVWKLNQLWKEMKEVPATIQDLMRQIEMIGLILSEHETNLSIQSTAFPIRLSTHNGAPAAQSVAYSREALNDLQRLVEDLNSAVESGKKREQVVGRVRVVLEKGTIKDFQDRLERAIRLVICTQLNDLKANATITRAMVTDIWTTVTDIQAQQRFILQQLNSNCSRSTERPPFPVITQDVDMSQEQTLDKRRRDQRQGNTSSIYLPWSRPSIFGAIMFRKSKSDAAGKATYAVRLQPPRWLSQSVWDISVRRACSGWQRSVSTWNIVPENSPGMLCVTNGDLDGLLDLFHQGLASPRDCDVDGETLFNVACMYSHTHIVKYFINMDLDITNMTAMNMETVCRICQGTLPIGIIRKLSSRGSFHVLTSAAENFQFHNGVLNYGLDFMLGTWCLAFISRQEFFDLCLRTYFPFWNGIPPRYKQEILIIATVGSIGWPASGVRRLICPDGPIRPIDTKAWNDRDGSILHVVFSYYLMEFSKAKARTFKGLLEEVIQATDDMYYATRAGFLFPSEAYCSALQTGLKMSLVHRFALRELRGRDTVSTLERLTRALQSLMSVLASCDYDLLEFGRQEAMTWFNRCNADSIIGDELYLGFRYDEVCQVRAVHYGAEPRDWYFEVDFHYEDYAGVFWNRIENPHLFEMPGAWVDEEWDSERA